MNCKILLLSILAAALAALCACGNGIDKLPGTSTGALTVQLTQPPPTPTIAGQPVGLVANALNDTKNGGVTWSCTPAGACGTFNPTTTGYDVDTQYTPPVAPANGPVTPNLAYSVTITATSVTDSTKSASTTLNIAQQYAFVQEGYGSWGVIGSVTLDGSGNVIAGEADFSCANPAAYCGGGGNGHFKVCPTGGSCNTPSSGYAFDAMGHGKMTLQLTNCCVQTNSLTFTSISHAFTAEDDQFSGLTFGGVGSFDLQTTAANFSLSQVSGGYSFTLTGYSGTNGAPASWGGVFTADGDGNITGGTFDENFGGSSGYSSVSFTGTYTAPDANGRGTITLSASPDNSTKPTVFAYYMVTPEVLRLTTISPTGSAAATGTAFGQGSLAGATATGAALAGSFIFSDFGFTNNAGNSAAAAGQFHSIGNGSIDTGIMDLNAFGTVTTSSLAGSTYSISGSPRGTMTASSGQTYNVYLTDPNLNLLDPNNTTGTGGALLLETDAADTVGVVIPQADAAATPAGAYAILLSDQSNPPNSDGGFTGQFTVSTTNGGTFSGEGDFQGTGNGSATPVVGPLSGTFTADGANPGRFTGTIVTAPAFPTDSPGLVTDPPGTENVSFYLANGSQGFIVETDSIAPVFGVIEAQGTIQSGTQKAQRALRQGRSSNASSRPVNKTTQHPEILRRSR
jgi:hypothetical protein